MQERPKYILPLLVFAQFAGTSLWFAGNAILPELQQEWPETNNIIGWITSSVQLGFIAGTLIFALFAVSDRFNASRIFLISTIVAGAATMLIIPLVNSQIAVLVCRFITGFFLAGIYPVGMKLAAGWYQKGLGRALGLLVGALVIGTAFPSFLRGLGEYLEWKTVIVSVSILSVIGGLGIFIFVPEGPFIKKGSGLNLKSIFQPFHSKDFRSAAFGYFGHMWELYAFWAFLPVFFTSYKLIHESNFNEFLWAAFVIGVGSIGCMTGGFISQRIGSTKVAFTLLLTSCVCCLLSPLFLQLPPFIFLFIMLIWGIAVAGDSPQFSAINAQSAPAGLTGTGLTAAVSIGFAITIISIQLLDMLQYLIATRFLYIFLFPGPLLGLFALRHLLRVGKY